MRKLLLIHGANLNNLGRRTPQHYGDITLPEIEQLVSNETKRYDIELVCFQSNHEGALIDFIQLNSSDCMGIIINPGAFTHYSYALHDALVDTNIPVVEVHLSDIKKREEWRRHSVIEPACITTISGEKEKGYLLALEKIMEYKLT